jgi:peptidase E
MSKDLVYIAGGNTVFMLEIWKKNKLEHIFKDAYEKGTILSGISAGAVCWFDWILSDSVGPGFKPLRGINLISGSCTPHSSNIERINQFESDIKNNKLPQGIAIDDGVAVVFVDGKPSEVYSSRKNHTAYFLDKNKKVNLEEYIKNI